MIAASESASTSASSPQRRWSSHHPATATSEVICAIAQIDETWARHRTWSATADLLKRRIVIARRTALILGIVAATLAVAAAQLDGVSDVAARVLGAIAGVAAGSTPLVLRRAGTDQIRNWTRARSASEGLKTEVYKYLAGGSRYAGVDRDQLLATTTRTIEDNMGDLLRYTLDVTLTPKAIPAVHDISSYETLRVDDQKIDYYERKARQYQATVTKLRRTGDLLGLVAVLLGVAVGIGAPGALSGWVPVVTTVAASVVAHIAAARYDHDIVEFLRTAQQLGQISERHRAGELDDNEFIDACEEVISVENQGWMTNWTKVE